ncbi:MAG TPA: DUF4293 family protein [Chitinophagaceae bacterium]|nr:DUF4293 family protein [Chitinophagaceae bacterium]
MIQRLQTLYFLLAGACGALLWGFDFRNNHNPATYIVLPVLVLLALAGIGLFKKRKLQLWLAIIGIILSGVEIYLEYHSIQTLETQKQVITVTHYFSPMLGLLMMLWFFLAARGIRKDNRLMRSRDRLR